MGTLIISCEIWPVIDTGTGWIRHVHLNVAGKHKLLTVGISWYILWEAQVLHHDLDLDHHFCRRFVKAYHRIHTRGRCTITSNMQGWS